MMGRHKQSREEGGKNRSEKKSKGKDYYSILNPSIYVSVRQEMNDDSVYIRAVGTSIKVLQSVWMLT